MEGQSAAELGVYESVSFFPREQMNGEKEGNTLDRWICFFYPISKWEVYGSVLLDDIQIEKRHKAI